MAEWGWFQKVGGATELCALQRALGAVFMPAKATGYFVSDHKSRCVSTIKTKTVLSAKMAKKWKTWHNKKVCYIWGPPFKNTWKLMWYSLCHTHKISETLLHWFDLLLIATYLYYLKIPHQRSFKCSPHFLDLSIVLLGWISLWIFALIMPNLFSITVALKSTGPLKQPLKIKPYLVLVQVYPTKCIKF